MSVILAEAQPLFIGQTVLALAALLGLAATAKSLFVRKPSIEAEFATRKEVSELAVKLEERIESQRLQFTRHFDAMHEKVNTIAKDVEFIRGKLSGKRHGE